MAKDRKLPSASQHKGSGNITPFGKGVDALHQEALKNDPEYAALSRVYRNGSAAVRRILRSIIDAH